MIRIVRSDTSLSTLKNNELIYWFLIVLDTLFLIEVNGAIIANYWAGLLYIKLEATPVPGAS